MSHLPAIRINFSDIIFDPEVQTYCNSPDYKCPNYNHSWACPPEAPYLEDVVSHYNKFFLIYYKFNLKKANKVHKSQKKQSNAVIKKNSYFFDEKIRDYLEIEIMEFIENYEKLYRKKLILWDGHCRMCQKEGRNCTYDQKKPCRYPDQIRYSMEAVGINVDKTIRNFNIPIEWPPVNHIYRFGLICLK